LQVLPFARQIIETIGLEHIVRLENDQAGTAAAARLWQVAKPEFFERQCFKRAALELPGGAEA
jgi:hypothetical protein